MELWERLRHRDEPAFEELINQYGPFVWGICGGILKFAGTAEDIEECVADVFVEIWRNPSKYNPERGTIETYLATLARSRAINAIRRIRPSAPLCDAMTAGGYSTEEMVIASETSEELAAALNRLREPNREIFYRRYFLDQKPREIALAMSITPREARNRLYEGKKEFKIMMGGYLNET